MERFVWSVFVICSLVAGHLSASVTNSTDEIFDSFKDAAVNHEESAITNRVNSSTPSTNATDSHDVNLPKKGKVIAELEHDCANNVFIACVQTRSLRYLRHFFEDDSFEVTRGVSLERVRQGRSAEERSLDSANSMEEFCEFLVRNLEDYSKSHRLSIRMPTNMMQEVGRSASDTARKWFPFFSAGGAAGKSSFLTGFGLGFLAFGLKKLLLPIFIGAQIVKSVMIAMFLPSLLGGLGKLVGKGVSTVASASSSSTSGGVDDFEFKDNVDMSGSESAYLPAYALPDAPIAGVTLTRNPGLSAGTLPAFMAPSAMQVRIQPTAASKAGHHHGSFYTRRKQPTQDYKVFHNIPSSSMLLTHYDPFYSPLLSRLDSVYQQLGYSTEPCRERLVCSMYREPAKFAPYSNLVSAQLSRELNELRKPSSDNPEILRFFRYMKAAKDGQDGQDCFRLHPGCNVGLKTNNNSPMIKTFNDINKLVQARKLSRSLDSNGDANEDWTPVVKTSAT